MSLDKLFGVLVMGGALLAVGGCSDEDRDDGQGPLTGAPDAAPGSADATPSPGDGGELAPCFCNVDACCERDESGAGTLQPGFECCWSTTCP